MHTDEYEISLWRELKVCTDEVGKLSRSLAELERKYGMKTEEFLARYHQGKLQGKGNDFASWRDDFAAFEKWEKRRRQYEQLLAMMKI